MLTIRAMAEMGLWILDRIEVLDGRNEHCQRCDTKIKNVWVMEKQLEPVEVWRIGSECGPKLEELSRELWEANAAPFRRSLRHLVTLERIVQWEREHPQITPSSYRRGWAAEQQRATERVLTRQQRMVMGSQVSRALEAWKRALACAR